MHRVQQAGRGCGGGSTRNGQSSAQLHRTQCAGGCRRRGVYRRLPLAARRRGKARRGKRILPLPPKRSLGLHGFGCYQGRCPAKGPPASKSTCSFHPGHAPNCRFYRRRRRHQPRKPPACRPSRALSGRWSANGPSWSRSLILSSRAHCPSHPLRPRAVALGLGIPSGLDCRRKPGSALHGEPGASVPGCLRLASSILV